METGRTTLTVSRSGQWSLTAVMLTLYTRPYSRSLTVMTLPATSAVPLVSITTALNCTAVPNDPRLVTWSMTTVRSDFFETVGVNGPG